MDSLTNIVVSIPDTIAIATPSKEVIFHSCPAATTIEDIFLALTIGIIVLGGLAIIGHYICKAIDTNQQSKINELNSRQQHELAKLKKEAEIKKEANEFNASQTSKQRQWLSPGDQIKIDIERLNLRLKEAEVNDKISKIEKNIPSKQDITHP